MIKRKSVFSIYILLVVIFGGVFHGSFMAYAGHIENMSKDLEMIMEKVQHNSSEQRVENSQKNKNSLMACCVEASSYEQEDVIFQNNKSEILNLEKIVLSDYKYLELKSAKADLSYKYFSPPERIILDSVIKIE